MKGVVAFDSFYGNTRQVAEAIADELRKSGHEASLLYLRQSREVPSEADFLIVGSPTRMGRMTGKAKRILKKLRTEAWKSRPIGVFDTHVPLPDDPAEREKRFKWVVPGAAGKLASLAEKRGLKVLGKPLRCAVKDMKGPLADGEIDKARAYAREFAQSLN